MTDQERYANLTDEELDELTGWAQACEQEFGGNSELDRRLRAELKRREAHKHGRSQ